MQPNATKWIQQPLISYNNLIFKENLMTLIVYFELIRKGKNSRDCTRENIADELTHIQMEL
jgi:hypothetical protein